MHEIRALIERFALVCILLYAGYEFDNCAFVAIYTAVFTLNVYYCWGLTSLLAFRRYH